MNSITFLHSVSPDEIECSARRLREALEGNYGETPIFLKDNPIGCITFKENKCYISFRGLLADAKEFLSTANIRKQSLGKDFGFKGKAHRGLYTTFLAIKETVYSYVKAFIDAHRGEMLEFICEGYSRGTGLAILMAAFLSDKVGPHRVATLAFSPIGVLNREGARNYIETLGVENHLNFIAHEDFIPPLLISPAGFSPMGTTIAFSARDSAHYLQRVEERQYTHLDVNFIVAGFIKAIFPPSKWEAHMPETYEDLSHCAFSLYRGFRS